MKFYFKLTGLALLLVGSVQARTWTSADGSKTFKADFKSLKGDQVTVMKNYSARSFDISILSEEDQQWIKAEVERQKQKKEEAKKSKLGLFGQNIKGKLEILNGKRYKKHSLEKEPKYYVLYYTASW